MNIFKLLLLFFCIVTCKFKDTNDVQTTAKENLINHKNNPTLVYLFGDGFLKNSYLNINRDTVLFIQDDIYKPYGFSFFNSLFFDTSFKYFKYVHSVHQELSIDTLRLLRKSNMLQQILVEARLASSPYYKKIIRQKDLLPAMTFLNKDSRIKIFDNKYYIVKRIAPDSLYQVDTVRKTVKAFAIEKKLLDVMNFLLSDLDKDGSPEVIFFHENMVPQPERLLYDVYSLRPDSVKFEIVHKKQ